MTFLVVHVFLHDGHRASIQTVERRHPRRDEGREGQRLLLLRGLGHLERRDHVDFAGHEVEGVDGLAELVAIYQDQPVDFGGAMVWG